jgi:hypothetical protein
MDFLFLLSCACMRHEKTLSFSGDACHARGEDGVPTMVKEKNLPLRFKKI